MASHTRAVCSLTCLIFCSLCNLHMHCVSFTGVCHTTALDPFPFLTVPCKGIDSGDLFLVLGGCGTLNIHIGCKVSNLKTSSPSFILLISLKYNLAWCHMQWLNCIFNCDIQRSYKRCCTIWALTVLHLSLTYFCIVTRGILCQIPGNQNGLTS